MVKAALPTMPNSGEYIRATELKWLSDRFAAERGGVVIVHGPRGVGKAGLAGHLKRNVRNLASTLTLEGRARSAGAGSFQPFADIVRQAMAWAEQNGLSDVLIDPVFADLEPVLSRAGQNDGAVEASLEQKLRFFEGVRGLMSALSERARTLVIIYDIEQADSDTLELASYLADNLFGDPALDPDSQRKGLFVYLLRDDRSTTDRARDFLQRSSDARTIETLALSGLDLEGLRRYVQTSPALTRLLEATDGLPSEVDELIESLPTNVEELFERKLESQPALQRTLLSALSVFDQPASARLLSVATEKPMQTVARALSGLRDARVLERHIAQGEIKFAFARRSNLEVTARVTSPEDIARFHAGWARALTQEPGYGGSALLAHHQLRSTEPTRGVPLALKAAEAHTVAGAFDAAAQLLETALPHSNDSLRVTILERLSVLASLRGQPRAAVRYVEQWKAAVPSDGQGRVLLREAELFNGAGDYDRALEALEQARPRLPTGAPVERASLESTAAEAHYQLNALDAARQSGREGLDALDAAGNDAPAQLRIALLNLLGKIALATDDIAGALEIFQETYRLAQKSGLGQEEARALVNLGFAQVRAGAPEEAEANLVAGIECASANNDLARLAFGNLNLGVLAHQKGELGRAIDCYRECRSLFSRLGNRTQLARVLYNLGNLYFVVGDLRRAAAHNDEALRIARAGGVERLIAVASTLDGVLKAELGERVQAENRLREAMILQRKLGAERPLETMVELASIQLDSGDAPRALATLSEVEPQLADLHNKQLSARAQLIRARTLLSMTGRNTEAGTLLTEVRDVFAALGERLLLRDSEYALGLHHSAAGHAETARMHLGSARAIQDAVAAELPAALRATFLAARPQAAVTEALQALDRGQTPVSKTIPPSMPEGGARADLPARPTIPPPAVRKPEWNDRYGSIIGRSPKLAKVFHILDRVSTSEDTVLITGESGTGKELVAEAIHRNSPRKKGPFVKLNCAALVESLLLSELFGHERGSFTGAHQRKVGRFEMAAHGTIFLDEIGDISPKTQVALLRVLQEFEFERVGGGRSIKLQARVVCATNRNLAQMVRDGTFREDLYYRLKGLTVELPALRDRGSDVGELAQYFLTKYAEESGTPAKGISASALRTLNQYRWPGNIRELENVIRSVALFADGDEISRRDLDEYQELFEDSPSLAAALGTPSEPVPPAVLPAPHASVPQHVASVPPVSVPPSGIPVSVAPPPPSMPATEPPAAPSGEDALQSVLLGEIFERGMPLAELKKQIQEQAIALALRTTKGNITRAAQMLGMKRPRLSQIINANEELKQLCQGAGR